MELFIIYHAINAVEHRYTTTLGSMICKTFTDLAEVIKAAWESLEALPAKSFVNATIIKMIEMDSGARIELCMGGSGAAVISGSYEFAGTKDDLIRWASSIGNVSERSEG